MTPYVQASTPYVQASTRRRLALYRAVLAMCGARLGLQTHDEVELICKPEHRAALVQLGRELGVFEVRS